ncbi:MAG: ATP-dependent helicase [Rubrivivax sp.]|nr:MAG: ATP-dependent helicase [Rubrivivax sp.]
MSVAPRFVPSAITPTDEQTAIQTATQRTLIVRANAGAAKTTTLALRVGEALARGTAPEKILVLTYTAPARQALQQALIKVGVPEPERGRLRIETFDGFAAHILLSVEGQRVPSRRTPEEVAPNVWQAIEKLQLETYPGLVERFLKDSCRLKGTMARDLAVWSGERLTPDLAEEIGVEHTVLRLFTAYEQIRYPGADHCDRPLFRWQFDATYDLARLLAEPEHITPLDEVRAWPWSLEEIMVDEMHDLNMAMFTLVKALLRTNPARFCGVGDFDQVIHAMAGAERRFMQDDVDLGAGRQVVLLPLTATRRFGPRLATVAGRLADKRYASDSPHATSVRCLGYTTDAQGAGGEDLLVAQARQIKADHGGRLSGLAVLLRHPHQSIAIENALLAAELPYDPVGFTSYLMQPEVLLVRGLLAVATGDYEQLASEATRRALVKAVVFFCDVKLEYQQSEAESASERLQEAVTVIARERAALEPFFTYQVFRNGDPAMVRRMQAAAEVARSVTGPEMFARFLEALDIKAWVNSKFVEKQRCAEAQAYFDGLRVAAARFADAKAFFAHLNQSESQFARSATSLHKSALATSRQRKGSLTLATIEAVKGLEFDHVVMPGLAQGEFPAHLAESSVEERNLFYVGMTRARQSLTLLVDRARPSEFIGQMGLVPDEA